MKPDESLRLFVHFLRTKDLHVTGVRRQIAQVALQSAQHFTASSLWIQFQHRRIALATIYRTLDLLCEAGLIRKLHLGNTQTQYEPLFKRSHGHLVCSGCHHWAEFTNPKLDEHLSEISEHSQWQAQSFDVKVVGLCPMCQEQIHKEVQ